ncbi:MAG: hypothetical protein RBG13Loki_3453 [Promethearchaeota archaeon CR_4]|nr:MAG: hypothetical protein RBG13Loki_3453 [Candidatus Lokiarchaeota archaeon CR_4]
MPQIILFEKSVPLKDGSILNIRERMRDEGTILLSFLRYLIGKIAANGNLDYPKIATEADQLFRVFRDQWLLMLDATVGTEMIGHATLTRHTMGEEQHLADVFIQVSEANRGMGVGRALLGAIIDYGQIKLQGVQKIIAGILATNDTAAKLFIKGGFSVHGIMPGRVQQQHPPVEHLLFVRDLSILPEMLELPEEGKRTPRYFPHWHETERERQEKLVLIGFLCGFDIDRYDEIDDSGIWDWASRFVLGIADWRPDILDGRTRIEYLQNEALRLIPLRYLRMMAKALGYVPPV